MFACSIQWLILEIRERLHDRERSVLLESGSEGTKGKAQAPYAIGADPVHKELFQLATIHVFETLPGIVRPRLLFWLDQTPTVLFGPLPIELSHRGEVVWEEGEEPKVVAVARVDDSLRPNGELRNRNLRWTVAACASGKQARRSEANHEPVVGFARQANVQRSAALLAAALVHGSDTDFIGRSLHSSVRLPARIDVKTPFQTVHADFPHTAYGWPLGSWHYAASG